MLSEVMNLFKNMTLDEAVSRVAKAHNLGMDQEGLLFKKAMRFFEKVEADFERTVG